MDSTLEEKINLFYTKYAPKMIQNDGLHGILAWTHNHGEQALNDRLNSKYGKDLTDVDRGTLEEHYARMHEALIDFYAKWDPFKDAAEVEGVFKWTQKHGLHILNERLMDKYKDCLTDTKPSAGSGGNGNVDGVGAKQLAKLAISGDDGKPRSDSNGSAKTAPKLPERKSDKAPPAAAANAASPAPVVVSTQQAAKPDPIAAEDPQEAAKDKEYKILLEKLIEYFSKHDPEKSRRDVEFLAGFASRNGFETVNHQLKLNFGVGMEDVGYVHKSAKDMSLLSQAAKPSKAQAIVPPPQPSAAAMAQASATTSPTKSALNATTRSVASRSISPEEELDMRRTEISSKLREFYKKNDPSRLLPENAASFNKVVEYGVEKGLVRLNGALREKFKEDLDDIQKAVLRKSVAPFFKQSIKGNAELQHKLAEEAVAFALQHGQVALDEKLKQDYGVDTTGNLGDV